MSDKKSYQSRDEIPAPHKWDLKKTYPTLEAWEADFQGLTPAADEIETYRGKLGTNEATLAKVWDLTEALFLKVQKLQVYAMHWSDEDTRKTESQALQDRIRSAYGQVASQLSWMDPEVLELPVETLKTFAEHPALKLYGQKLRELIRSKPHRLTAKEERILSLAAEPMSASEKTYGMFKDAELQFPPVKVGGKDQPLSHGTYIRYLEDHSPEIRREAFEKYNSTFLGFKNTFASLLDGQVKAHLMTARARNFNSALEAALFDDAIPPTVYKNLIKSVRSKQDVVARWVRLKKKVMKANKMDLYDLYVPIVKEAESEVPYELAWKWILESLKPLGEEYQKVLLQARDENWIDVFESPGKRSGAYSGGMFLTPPYILLNHQDTLRCAFTLAHELGHSLHSYFSRKYQPSQTAEYPIFLAEVASTTNEMLLHHYLMRNAPSEGVKLGLLDNLCSSFRGTLIRQTQFAEFEMGIHERAENGVPLTAEEMSSYYGELNQAYYGPDLAYDPLTQIEWARIPHFYYNFYVYKYATSFAAAQYFADQIFQGDAQVTRRYLEFLRSGGIALPLETMKKAGVDLEQPDPILSALKVFEETLAELERKLLA
jgi:oligoendopeptidase F